MSDDEKQLLKDYREMTPQNKRHLLSLAHVTRAAQETTKSEMDVKSSKKRKAG